MLMIDIETLSTKPGPIIIQLGWAYADATKIAASGFVNVKPGSCHVLGGDMNLSTIEWWITKGGAKAYKTTMKNRQAISVALDELDSVFKTYHPTTVWGNAPTFDLSALRFYYTKLKRTPPWAYLDERCYRTERAEHGHRVQAPAKKGAHNGEADARWQLEHLLRIQKALA